MSIFKMVFLAALAFFAGVAIFIGAVLLITSLQNGAVIMSYTEAGRPLVKTFSRATDPNGFWRLLLAMGVAPVVIGAGVLWYAVRNLRKQ